MLNTVHRRDTDEIINPPLLRENFRPHLKMYPLVLFFLGDPARRIMVAATAGYVSRVLNWIVNILARSFYVQIMLVCISNIPRPRSSQVFFIQVMRLT